MAPLLDHLVCQDSYSSESSKGFEGEISAALADHKHSPKIRLFGLGRTSHFLLSHQRLSEGSNKPCATVQKRAS